MLKLFRALVHIALAMFLMVHSADAKANCPPMKLKRQWGGKSPQVISYRPVPIKYVIIHHTVTPECTDFLECAEILQNIQYYQVNTLEYEDIGYK